MSAVKIFAFLDLEPRLNIKNGFNRAGKNEHFSKVSTGAHIVITSLWNVKGFMLPVKSERDGAQGSVIGYQLTGQEFAVVDRAAFKICSPSLYFSSLGNTGTIFLATNNRSSLQACQHLRSSNVLIFLLLNFFVKPQLITNNQ